MLETPWRFVGPLEELWVALNPSRTPTKIASRFFRCSWSQFPLPFRFLPAAFASSATRSAN